MPKQPQTGNTPEQPAQGGGSLRERMLAQSRSPASPPSSQTETLPTIQPTDQQPGGASVYPPQMTNAAQIPARETPQERTHTSRPTYYNDEERDIEWLRTGMEIPTAFWRGIVAYVTGQKIRRTKGQTGKVVQKDVFAEALGAWLNDHRHHLPPDVAADIDEVRAKLERLP